MLLSYRLGALGVVRPEPVDLSIKEPGGTIPEGAVADYLPYFGRSVLVLVHCEDVVVGNGAPAHNS